MTEIVSPFSFQSEMSQKFRLTHDKPTLTSLPCEIQLKIAQFLNQYDVLSLARTSKAMAEISLRRIYSTVVVDAAYSQFESELPRYTYVNLLYNFRKLLRSKGRKHVQAFRVISLPCLFDCSNVGSGDDITEFMGGLSSLTDLKWHASNFALSRLLSLPNANIISSLELRLDIFEPTTSSIPEAGFGNLRRLCIQPFLCLDQLHDLLHFLLGSSTNLVLLKSLELAHYEKPRRLYLRPIFEGLESWSRLDTDSLPNTTDFQTSTISTLFTSTFAGLFAGLTRLCLKSVIVSENDAYLLIGSGVLPHLKTLALKDVWEFFRPDTNSKEDGVLPLIGTYLKDLAHLEIDYNEWRRDTVADLLCTIPRLTSLHIWIHTDQWKASTGTADELLDSYFTAIARHGGLQLLELHMGSGYGRGMQYQLVQPLLLAMDLLALRYLRLDCWREFEMQDMIRIFQKLVNLRFLGLGEEPTSMVLDLHARALVLSIVPSWVLEICQCQRHLEYVKLGERVFEIKDGKPQNRDALHRWFEELVRI